MQYGHHRQTSIVNGYQHSRNGSVASSSSSPLSPQIIAAAGGAGVERPDASNMSIHETDPPGSSASSIMGNSIYSSSVTLVPDRSSTATENSVNTVTPKRMERMHSQRSRREHGRHQSNSRRHHNEELKTVGEYALHVLFTSFIAQAEEKIAQCITTPLEAEPQIEYICGPGADPTFDQLISALGHIASQKPKPLIDTLMYWRKNKSDAANDARTQLQQVSKLQSDNGYCCV